MAQLRQRQQDFDRLNTQILLISSGSEEGARNWAAETGAPFPLLLDRELVVYRAYGLGRSVLRVWSLKVLWHYLRLLLRGRRLRPIQGDPHQLGGDFLIGPEGTILLAHPSRDPTDRPSTEGILAVVGGGAGRQA